MDGSSSSLPEFLKVLTHEIRWNILTRLAQSDYSVAELVNFLQQPQNVVSYHLRKLREQHIIHEHHSSVDERSIYYSLETKTFRQRYLAVGEAIHPALNVQLHTLSSVPTNPVKVLFLCTRNSARSQIAEGLLRQRSHGEVEVYSAGSDPSELHPLAIRAAAARDVDIRQQRSHHVNEYREISFDVVVTVCDRMREVCPSFPDTPDLIHWSLPDPVDVVGSDEERYQAFERVTQQLETRVQYLLTRLTHSDRHSA